MKRFVALSSAAALVIIMISPSVQEALVQFIIAGLVPGTTLQLSPMTMMAVLSVAMACALYVAYRQAQAVSLPSVEELRFSRVTRRRETASIWRRRNALRPKLKLLQ